MIRIARILLAITSIAVIAFIYFRNIGLHSELNRELEHIANIDKLGHFLIFGTLSFLAVIASNFHRIRLSSTYAIYSAAIILSVIVTFEEFSQLLLSNRTFELLDLSANLAGVLSFSYIASLIEKRISTPQINTERK